MSTHPQNCMCHLCLPGSERQNIKQPEPAEKTLTLEISEREIIVLAKWHASQTKSIAKKFGEAVLKVSSKSIFGSARGEMAALKKLCDEEIKKHSLRANGLISLLKK